MNNESQPPRDRISPPKSIKDALKKSEAEESRAILMRQRKSIKAAAKYKQQKMP